MDAILSSIVNEPVEVEYLAANGKLSKLEGKLISFDSLGYVVIESAAEKKTFINKEKVHTISQKSRP